MSWMSPKEQERIEHIRKTIAEKIPTNLVVPEHTEYGHFYRHTGADKAFASVTTKTGVLNNERLKRWAARLAVEYIDRNWKKINDASQSERDAHFKAATLAHEDELKDAGDIGTRGHEAIERYLNRWIETGERPADIRRFIIGEDARLWAITRSAEQFCKDFDVIPIASELKVASLRYKYAGTLDSLMMIRKNDKYVFAIVDWKTSNQVDDKPEYVMQTSAYWQALNEMTRTNPRVARTGLIPEETVIVQIDKDKMKYKVVKLVDRPGAFKAFTWVSKIYDYLHNGISKTYPYTPKKDTFIT